MIIFCKSTLAADIETVFTLSSETYNDVPEHMWYAEYINSLSDLGLLNGVGNGYFQPEK